MADGMQTVLSKCFISEHRSPFGELLIFYFLVPTASGGLARRFAALPLREGRGKA
jgi:hypothetical protein